MLRIGVGTLATFYRCFNSGKKCFSLYFIDGGSFRSWIWFYWLAFNLLTFEITEPETRDFFNGFLGLLTSFSGMIGPIAAGYTISRMEKWSGYTVIFFLSLVLFAIAVVLSFLSKRECEGRYEITQVLKERRIDKIGEELHVLIFPRIERGNIYFVISVYVYLATDSELALGKYSLVNSAVSFVCYYLVARMLKKEWRKSNFTWRHYFICGRIFSYIQCYIHKITYLCSMHCHCIPYFTRSVWIDDI